MVRQVFNMNMGWRFREGDVTETNFDAVHKERYTNPHWIKSGNHGVAKWGYDDSKWNTVQIPHDFVLERGQFSEQVPASHGSLTKGIGWYRKTFVVSKEDLGSCLSIEFDGVFRNSSVWVNGHFLGNEVSGYTSFSYDITDVANYGGPNVVAVRVDASEFEGWWYEGGGIYRDVRMVKTDRLRVPQWGTFIQSEVTTDGSRARVTVETEVKSEYEQEAAFKLYSKIYAPDGTLAAQIDSAATIPGDDTLLLSQTVDIIRPALWSIDTPQLYKVKSVLELHGRIVDEYDSTFGIRTVAFDAEKGFILNGTPVKLKGVCCHEDHAGVGMAVPAAVNEFRIRRLKEMGSNAYRTSHNPPAPSILEACDRLGMVVIDEVRQTETSEDSLNQLRSLIRRDRNHPSVILWSLGNEEMNIQGRPVGVRILHRMQKLAHRLDPTRKCTYGMNADWLRQTVFHEENGFHIDVHGFNYMMKRNWNAYDEFRKKYPDAPFTGSENASTLSTRGVYRKSDADMPLHISEHGHVTAIWSNPDREGLVSAYGETYPLWGAQPEEAWRAATERDDVAGLFVWTGFDYRGETFPYEWPSVISRYGIMDLCGFAKDIFYYYQARWTDEPVLHLFPHWSWQGSEGEVIDVWAFSNLDEIELFLNGHSIGKRAIPAHGHAEWKVAYTAGVLSAYGYRNGEQVLVKVIETTSEPARVELSSARMEIKADHEDICLVQVAITDAAGRLIPDADQEISFSIEGPGKIIGTGNGNPESHEDDKRPQRKAFHGLCQVLVQSTGAVGDIRLTAKAAGLEVGRLLVKSKETNVLPLVPTPQLDSDDSVAVERRDAADGGI